MKRTNLIRLVVSLLAAWSLILTGSAAALPAEVSASPSAIKAETPTQGRLVPKPGKAQNPMSLRERRNQVIADKTRGMSVSEEDRVRSEPPKKIFPEAKPSTQSMDAADPGAGYYQMEHPIQEIYDSKGKLVAYSHLTNDGLSVSVGFFPKPGEEYTYKTEVYYDNDNGGGSDEEEEEGPQSVSIKIYAFCSSFMTWQGKDYGYFQTEPIVLENVPSHIHSADYDSDTVPKRPGVPVSFTYKYSNQCLEAVEKKIELGMYAPSAEYFFFGAAGLPTSGVWPTYSSYDGLFYAASHASVPANQTYGTTCDENAASASSCQSQRGIGVNSATGAFGGSYSDATLEGRDEFDVTRSYSSNNEKTGMLGTGWSTPWEASLDIQSNGNVVLHAEDGSEYPFTKSEKGYSVPPYVRSNLSSASNGYSLKTHSGDTYEFSASGDLNRKVNKQGRIASYTRDSGGRLASISQQNGNEVEFSYAGSRLESVKLSDGRIISYGYTDGRLTNVGGPNGAIEYSYAADGHLDEIVDQRHNSVVKNQYDSLGRVEKQTDAAGEQTLFSYKGDETDITAPDGGVWTDIHSDNVLTDQYDPFGNRTSYQYSFGLEVTQIVDPLGRITTRKFDGKRRITSDIGPGSNQRWSYQADGNVSWHQDGNGKISYYEYNDGGNLAKSKDPEGNSQSFTYNGSGQLETYTSASQKTITVRYDELGRQTAVIYPDQTKETRRYDSFGHVASVTDPRGNLDGADPEDFTTTYTNDSAGRVLTSTDPKKNTTTNKYDDAGNLETVTDSKGRTTKYSYDNANRLIKVEDPAGNITTTTYDHLGNVASRTDATEAKTSYTYDNAGQMVSMTTPRGNVAGADAAAYTWKYGYDKVGNQTTVTDPTGKTTKTDYDAENHPVKVTDPLGHFTETSYDGEGNVRTTTDELGKVTTNTYDDNGRLSSVKDRGSKPFSYSYDDDGNLTSETTPLGFKTTYSYDDNGRLTDRVEPRGNVTGADPAQYAWHTGYDAAGNVTSQKDPLGNEATTTYDAVNNVTESTDRRGKKTLYEYDTLYRLKKVTAPDGGIILVEYDDAGLMSKRTDDNQHATAYEYDKTGRLTKITDPLKRATSYEYDPDGNRKKVTNARGQTITTTYDGRNLPGTITYSDGTPKVTHTYYDDTRPKTITDGTGTRTVTYDLAGRPLSITQPGLTTPFKYTYNPNGTVASRTYPDGYATAYKYDDDGRLSTQTSSGKTTTYGWDEAGNLTSTKLPTTTALTENRTYDRAGQLASISEKTGTRQLSRDPDGRILTDSFKDAATTGLPDRYAYDEAGRITRACTDTATNSPCTTGTSGSTYHYDKVGNLTSSSTSTTTRTNTHDAADQLTKRVEGTTTTDFTYDLDGNLTKDATGTYTYDPAGRTKSATIGANTLTFVNDADGNRTLVNKNGTLDRTTRWDINNPLAQVATETSSAGNLIADYEYNVAGVAQAQNRTSGTFYMLHDRQDSVRAVHDATGKEVYTYTYDAWGISTGTASTTGGQTSIFGYTGQYKDPYVSGRLNLRDRTYDPANRRFTTTDPEPSTAGTPNSSPYAYANNDPANQSDPSGRCPLCVSAGIGAVIGAAVEGGIYSYQHRNDGQFSWSGFGKAAGRGAATGAVAGLLMPGAGNAAARGLGMSGWRGVATSTAVNAGVGAGFSWAVNEVHCRPTDPWDLLWGAAGGATSSLVGPAFGWLRAAAQRYVSQVPRVTTNTPAAARALPVGIGMPEGPATLYGPFHRLASPTQTVDHARAIVESSELWGKTPRWGGNATAQAHRGPIPASAKPGSLEFYTTVRPKPQSRTPHGYVSWEEGVEKGVIVFVKDGEDWASIPIIITEVR